MVSRETSPARTTSFVGSLLVATPTLQDPNFDRTVVIGVGHESDGVLGVVLNRVVDRQSEAYHQYDSPANGKHRHPRRAARPSPVAADLLDSEPTDAPRVPAPSNEGAASTSVPAEDEGSSAVDPAPAPTATATGAP